MLHSLIFIMSIKASAASDGLFGCYRSAKEIAENKVPGSSPKYAINFLTDFSFNILTDGKVAVCEIQTPASSEHHGGPPFRVQIPVAGKPHYFLYARDKIEEVPAKKAAIPLFPKANCSAAASIITKGTWEKAIQDQLNQAEDVCNSDDKGGSGAQRTCYNHFYETLKLCAKVKLPEMKTYIDERTRALEAHMNFKGSMKAELTESGDGDAGK